VDTDRVGASIRFGDQAVLKLFYRMEEGTAPELEIARHFQSDPTSPFAGITARVLGFFERRSARREPTTLALLEELVMNEGTAWQHARSEIGRMYERVIAQPPGSHPPP